MNDVHNMLNSSGNFLGHMDNETELNVRDAYNYARERTADFLALAENQTDVSLFLIANEICSTYPFSILNKAPNRHAALVKSRQYLPNSQILTY